MRKSAKSKILSLVLCMSMIISTFAFIPGLAYAEKTDSIATDQTTSATEPATENPTEPVEKVTEPEVNSDTEETDADKDSKTETKADEKDQSPSDEEKTDVQNSSVKTVDFTNVAPFLSPVAGKSTSLRQIRSIMAIGVNVLAIAAGDDESGTERVDSDGVVTTKTATKNDDGTYKIRLESYVTGSTTTTTVTEDVPTDIVLVLDRSGSMNDSFGNNNRALKLTALKVAAKNFSDEVAKKTSGTDGKTIDHRIAVVSYADNATNDTNGFKQMSDTTQKQAVDTAIQKLRANGGTHINEGLSTANKIFASNPINSNEKRNRVVIVFTDGAPGDYGDWCSESVSTANDAISNAKTSKNTYGATVYSVGIFDGADASNPGQLPEYTGYTDGGWWGDIAPKNADQIKNSNRFMHLLSSNYPESSSITNPGTINSNLNGKSYYLSASDSNALNNIFQQISNQIQTGGASVKLDSSTVVKDVISDYFELPKGADASSITLKTADFNGYDSDGTTPKWSAETLAPKEEVEAAIVDEGKTVKVDGFDFSENYVGIDKSGSTENPRGKKLIIEFDVKAKDGFLGGNSVPTNGADSGIYTVKDGTETVVENFEQPTANVPIKDVTVIAADKNVYLLSNVTADEIKNGATVKVGDIDLDLSKANDTNKPYGLEQWQTEYVNIAVAIKDKELSDFNDLVEDQNYKVSVTISPKTEGTSGESATTQTGSNDGNIYVFKPELTFKDSTVYYGDTEPDGYSDNLVNTIWKHGDTEANTEKMGKAPDLTIEYIVDSSKIDDGQINTKADVNVDAKVKIGKTDVTPNTIFVHRNCDNNCSWNIDEPDGTPAFLLHVKTCSLTVTKTGGKDDEPYVMNIYKGNDLYTQMTITGNRLETIKELPVGTYTVREDTDWSWRYKGSAPTILPNNGVTLSKDKITGTIEVENHDRSTSFLNGYSTVVKNVFGESN